MTRQSGHRIDPAPGIPLVVHIIYRLDVGGLENGLVNIINRMPADRYRHTIICLTDYSDFRFRIHRTDVELFAMNKRQGNDFRMYIRLWRLLRKLRPAIVHTRNLAALESTLVARLACIQAIVQGEHGRDVIDLDGSNWKYNLLRRICRPFIRKYIPVSHDLERWLRDRVKVNEQKIFQIYNGVDTCRFHPKEAGHEKRLPAPNFTPSDVFVIGFVGRLEPVKDPLTLVKAFVHLLESVTDRERKLRLVLVGNGSLAQSIKAFTEKRNVGDLIWMAGARNDIPEILRDFDIFVLPSMAEGVSNTILEAMATGLPVVASRVGGTPELVKEGKTGVMVPANNPRAMAQAIERYIQTPELIKRHGQAARERVEREFSLECMVERYLSVYDAMLAS